MPIFDLLKEHLGWVLFLVGAVATLATNTGRAKKWLAHRTARQMKLDEILEHSSDITCTKAVRECHEAIFEKLTGSMDRVEHMLDKVQQHNEAQDSEIEKSKEERAILMSSNLALLDFMIKQGANGSAHKARAEVQAFLMKETHK